jgi:dTDP-4-amino-4,6-dideoxygalactose transaminase
MAFFSILECLGIGIGDEVILPAFTCSVMPNAVWRIGAVPVFADINPRFFGSGLKGIKAKISPRTKMIVAQHSFGIPCEIQAISELARNKNIFLLEDCAITFDSMVNGVKVGNFGDAAIFSTDHSKPLNTLIGGFLYTKNNSFFNKILRVTNNLMDLDQGHQERLFQRLLFEIKNYIPTRFNRIPFLSLKNKIIINKSKRQIFLDSDYGRSKTSGTYPYPAKMPAFLAQLGIFELLRWPEEKKRRKRILSRYLTLMSQSKLACNIPDIYSDSTFEITPLRYIFRHQRASEIISKMKKYIDTNLILFRQPIVCLSVDITEIGYKYGDCRNAESVCSSIINWPCVIPESEIDELFVIFKYFLINNGY